MPVEEQLKLLQSQLAEIQEQFSFHNHNGMDSQTVDYRRLQNKPINNEKVIDGLLGGGGMKIESGKITATNLEIISGAANVAHIVVGTGATAGGLNSASAGGDIVIWAGSAFADRATADFRVTAAGAMTASSATITGGAMAGWTVIAGYLYSLTSGTPTASPSDGIVLASTNPNISIYENTEKRVEMGYLSAGVFGFKAYNNDGTTPIFEISDTQKMLAGWIFDNQYLYKLASGTPGASPSDGLVIDGSATPAIKCYENTELRCVMGYLGAGIYGLKSYNDDGAEVLFEMSDTQKVIAGWTVSATTLSNATNIILDASAQAISINDATFGNTGIQLQYNSGTPRFYCGDGANQALNFDGTNLTVNNSPISNQDLNGDGNDGDVTISSNTNLTRDMFYDSLIVNNGAILNMAGFRIFAKTKITVTANSYIQRTPNNGGNGTNGSGVNAGTAGTAGAALADGSLKGALAGIVGTIGAVGVTCQSNSGDGKTPGTNGTAGASVGADSAKSLVASNGATGTNGSAGGTGTSPAGTDAAGTAGAGATGGSRTGTVYNQVRSALAAYLMWDLIDSGALTGSPSSGSAATGGTGSCSASGGNPISTGQTGGSGGSGGGGSCGGIGVIFAKEIQVDSGSYIRMNGGNGGNGGASADSGATQQGGAGDVGSGGSGGSGGGNGGNGGILILIYSKLTESGTIEFAGGTGGTGGAAGALATVGAGTANAGTAGLTGTAGNAGRVIKLQV